MLGTLYFVVVSCLNTCMSKEEVLVDTPTTNNLLVFGSCRPCRRYVLHNTLEDHHPPRTGTASVTVSSEIKGQNGKRRAVCGHCNLDSSILHVHYCSPRSEESKLAIPFGRLNTIISYLSEGEYLT